jgi:chondroitin 4-sulfotransferase 11
MPISDKYKVIFLHIPKTGGSSIEQLLDIKESAENLLNRTKPGDGMMSEPQHRTYDQLKQIVPATKFRTYTKFAFVRNPWDRLVSAYHYDKRGFKQFDDFVKFVHHLYQTYNDKTIFSYPKFNTYRCSHLLPQYLFIGPDVTVYRFERFNQECRRIIYQLNIKKLIPQKNSTQHRHYSRYYNSVTQNMVAQIYSRDIELFNYTFERK